MIRAKFKCSSVTKDFYGNESVSFFPVYAADGPNLAWAKATPGGKLDMTISNPDAQGKFVPGEEYFLDITPAPVVTP